MPQLPERPNPGQLRRQARELHRAARAGGPGALGPLRPFSDRVTLSTAQLAIAREYGCAISRAFQHDVARRRTAFDEPERDVVEPVKSSGASLIEAAMRPGHRLAARVRLSDAKGNPVCARVHPPALTWPARKCG